MQLFNEIVCSKSIYYFGTKHIASFGSFGAIFEFNFLINYLKSPPNCKSIIFLGINLEMEGEWCEINYIFVKLFLMYFFFSQKNVHFIIVKH